MKTHSLCPRELPTSLQQRRQAAGLRLCDLAQIAGFSVSKVFRIEKAPLRARVADLVAIDRALDAAEREAGGGPDFPAALSAAVEPGR
jgi:predicted transcriptional regulator